MHRSTRLEKKTAVKKKGRLTERQAGVRTNRVRIRQTNAHEDPYCMDNDMVLEMKAETMQIALTLTAVTMTTNHLKLEVSPRGWRRGRWDRRNACVLILQFGMSSMCLPNAHKSSQNSSTGKLNLSDSENFSIAPAKSFRCLSFNNKNVYLLKASAFLCPLTHCGLAAPPLHVLHM